MNSLIITKCPHCGSNLEFDGIHLMCNNEMCSGRIKAKVQSSISVLEIKNLGQAMINEMVDNGLNESYQLLQDGFIEKLYANGFKKTANTEKVNTFISGIKEIELYKMILLMGIDNLGKATAVQIANNISGIQYSYSGLEKEVVSGFDKGSDNYNKLMSMIDIIKSNGIDVVYPTEEKDMPGVEFTGSPKPLFATKDEFLSFIKKYGYTHVKLAQAKYLITDSYESSSSKMNDAKKKGIEILTYNDFKNKLENGK